MKDKVIATNSPKKNNDDVESTTPDLNNNKPTKTKLESKKKSSSSNKNILYAKIIHKKQINSFSKNKPNISNKTKTIKHIYIETREKSQLNEENSLEEYLTKQTQNKKELNKSNITIFPKINFPKTPDLLRKKKLDMTNNNIFGENIVNNLKKMKLKTKPIKLKDLNENIKLKYQSTNYTKNLINNNESILNSYKEIELLNKENLYKTSLINNLQQQIEEYKKNKELMDKQSIILKELKALNEEIPVKQNNSNLNKFEDKSQIELFDKLKNNYSNNLSIISELQKQNEQLKKEINNITNPIKKDDIKKLNKNTQIGNKNNNNNNNLNKNNIDQDKYSSYIQKNYLLSILKENIEYIKPLNDIQKNEIHFLIQMTILGNGITEEILMNFLFKNLSNFQKILKKLIFNFIKINNKLDNKIITNYFLSITNLNNIENIKNFQFYILKLFDEFYSYFFNIDIKNIFDSKKIHEVIGNNVNINILIKECKYQDQLDTGLIEFKKFNEIFTNIYGNFNNNIENHNLYIILIYLMKNYKKIGNLGLYYLNYENLNSDQYPQILKNVNNKTQNLEDINDFNLLKKIDDKNIHFYSNNNTDHGDKSSDSYGIMKNHCDKKENTKNSEEIIANVEINMQRSTTYVKVKLLGNSLDESKESSSFIKHNYNEDIHNNDDKVSNDMISEFSEDKSENKNIKYDYYLGEISKTFVDEIIKDCQI